MAKVDLSKYDLVKTRKKIFYADNPDGSILVELINKDTILDHAVFKATIYRNKEEQEKGLPWAVGYAHEIREKELSKSREGKEYASVNYTSWCENCEESAVGRALDNAGYAGGDKCSREEMDKAERNRKVLEAQQIEIKLKKDIADNMEQMGCPKDDMAEWVNTKRIAGGYKYEGLLSITQDLLNYGKKWDDGAKDFLSIPEDQQPLTDADLFTGKE